MEKKHIHVQHSRLANSGYLTNCRNSDSRFHLGVILLLGLLSIGLLIGLLVANTQYNTAKSQLTTEIQNLERTCNTAVGNLESKIDQQSQELVRARNLAKSNSDSKCTSNEELNNLTDSLRICNETLFNVRERAQLPTDLPEEASGLESLSEQNTTCPDGWTKFNCSCYQSFGPGSWDEGREDCARKGGDLVVIDDPEEQTFVSTFAKSPLWIGLSDKETEGSWKWVDGTSLSFTYWAKTQPDGDINTLRGDEDCVLISSYDGLFWHDFPCSLSMHWICEKVLAEV
ncbi:C-type lectin domain family 10 member A-like isoform 2-T2 [Fundulus diaphanus]